MVPIPVATPFPPLKFKKGEKICPKMTKKPAEAIEKEVPINRAAIQVAKTPLRKSKAKTKAPGPLPRVLTTLVAPTLPDPCSLRSI